MNRWIRAGLPLLAAGLCLTTLPAARAQEETVKPLRTEPLANAPGQSLTAATVTFAPGGKSGGHVHAGSVFAYVLAGAIRSENSATGPAQVYHAGESFFEPAGSHHLVCENVSATEPASLLVVFVAPDGAHLTTFNAAPAGAPDEEKLARQIFETMAQIHGVQPGHRLVHARGLVCTGTFSPTPDAASLSRAAHFQRAETPVTVRFSDGSPDPLVPDNSPDAGPRGLAVRFQLPDGSSTDIVAMSHHGFVVGTGPEFLALQQAILATDPAKPHPWPVEAFLGAHPLALKFVLENRMVPESFAREDFFSNDAFVLVNWAGKKQPVRYQLLPAEGSRHLGEAEAKGRPATYLTDDLTARLAQGPVRFRLVAQLPNPGEATADPSLVWPADRRTVELGVLRVTTVTPDNATAAAHLAFDPANLTDGLELSDDPLPALRSRVYDLARKHRQHAAHPVTEPKP